MNSQPDRPGQRLSGIGRGPTSRLAFILAFAFGSRLLLALWVQSANPSAVWHPDSTSYQRMAFYVLQYGPGALARIPAYVFEAQRPWGLPLLLAGSYRLFGIQPLPFILFQILLSSGTIVLTWLLARRFTSEPKAALAAANGTGRPCCRLLRWSTS